MTGARVPIGTVAVVPVEDTDASPTGPRPDRVRVERRPAPGAHVREVGEDVHGGAVLAGPGRP
jgi:molybdopterin molybdotransferase